MSQTLLIGFRIRADQSAIKQKSGVDWRIENDETGFEAKAPLATQVEGGRELNRQAPV